MDISFNSRRIPEQFNPNLASKRIKTGDIQFNMPVSLNFPYLMQLAKQMYKQGYPQGEGAFEYRDPEFRFYAPQVDWSQILRTAPVRGTQTTSTGASL